MYKLLELGHNIRWVREMTINCIFMNKKNRSGKIDCIDGDDETRIACDRRESCQQHEFKCRLSGICISKSKFCDKVKDCGTDDMTDEPDVCSCFSYLA